MISSGLTKGMKFAASYVLYWLNDLTWMQLLLFGFEACTTASVYAAMCFAQAAKQAKQFLLASGSHH